MTDDPDLRHTSGAVTRREGNLATMLLKNSQTSPLRIAEVLFAEDEGRLGLTLCPGKKDRTKGWERDLAADLRVIRAWGAHTVVSLMEDHEFSLLDVAALGDEVRRHGLDWMHLPIRDVDVPDSRFEQAWALAGQIVHARLDAGQRILIHCRGGLGRTGLVAARVLVERGCAPRVAIHRVRAVRPHAIETTAQEAYVLKAHRREPVDDWAARVLASLLGGALGDAAGYLVEFEPLEAIRREYGAEGLKLSQLERDPLTVSDDTQMTLFTLEGLLAAIGADAPSAAEVEAHLREAYLDWYGTQAPTARAPVGQLARDERLRHRRAPGNTCLTALQALGMSASPQRASNDSKGCGTVMRTAPIGWFRRWSVEEAFAIGRRASAITHGHPTAILAGAAMAAIVRAVLGGEALAEAAQRAARFAAAHPGHEETVAAIAAALAAADSSTPATPETVATLGEGWVAQQALAIGLYAALKGESMARALEIALNHGGDSDSTASIAGQLRGAAEGLRGIPYGLVRRLDLLVPMLELTAAQTWD